MTHKTLKGFLAILALALTATAPFAEDAMNERYTRGWEALVALAPEKAQAVQDALADIAPDMADFILDFSYGDVISRTVLTPAQKEIAMVAAATARGTMAPQLKVHAKAALAVGMTREQLAEVVIQMAVYAGFPAALNGLTALREAFAEVEG